MCRYSELLLELFRRYTCHLFKLSAKMLHVMVSTPVGNLCNRILMVSKILFSQSNSTMDNIIHTGQPKGFFINKLQVPSADTHRFSHSSNCPWVTRIVVNRCSKFHQWIMLRANVLLNTRFQQLVE